jgi:MoxR-like ATPase
VACPLRVCVGAANSLPEDESLAAFADRFLLRLFVAPVADSELEALLEGGWRAEQASTQDMHMLGDLDLLAERVLSVDLDGIRAPLADAVRQLRKAGLSLSDRRIVRTQRLIAAATVLAGRCVATRADLWPLFYVLPSTEAQLAAQEALRDSLQIAANPTLSAAAELAAQQPASRVDRLVHAARACLQAGGEDTSRTLAEALLREIDANFVASAMPEVLAVERTRLVAHVSVSA